MTTRDTARDALETLGLSAPEAEVYVHLLGLPRPLVALGEPVTAYRVGKDLGRATANVYKAVDALAARGAVVLGEGTPRTCRAVEPAEVLAALRDGWERRSAEAARSLQGLAPPPMDERVYELRSPELVLERCRRMLAAAETVAVVDVFPGPFAAIRTDLAACAARGVQTFVQVYEPPADAIPGADVVQAADADDQRRHRLAQTVNCVVDAQEALVALLSHRLERVVEATWTRRLYLCCALHGSLLREHAFHRVTEVARSADPSPALRAALDASIFLDHAAVPGHRALLRAADVGVTR